jgi:hypothetical protein
MGGNSGGWKIGIGMGVGVCMGDCDRNTGEKREDEFGGESRVLKWGNAMVK